MRSWKLCRQGFVFLGNERALHRLGADCFVVPLADTVEKPTIVGLADTRRNTEVSGEITSFGKAPDVADGG